MGSEASLWKTLRKNMYRRWEATRVENPAAPGTPDVYYTLIRDEIPRSKWLGYPKMMGWLELKYLHKWPKKESTVITIEHFTPQQKNFIRTHGKAGANIKLLLQVKKDYLLFDWKSSLLIGKLTQEQMRDECIIAWFPRIDFDEFLLCLC